MTEFKTDEKFFKDLIEFEKHLNKQDELYKTSIKKASGNLQVNTKMLMNSVNEFNQKFNTSFNENSTENEIYAFFIAYYKNELIKIRGNIHYDCKALFNQKFYPFATIE